MVRWAQSIYYLNYLGTWTLEDGVLANLAGYVMLHSESAIRENYCYHPETPEKLLFAVYT